MGTSSDSIKTIGSEGVEQARDAGVTLIDVRPAAMYEAGHIPGAVNVPLVEPADGSMVPDDQLKAAVESAGVQPDDDVVLYCQTGYHAGLAAQTLAEEGFQDVELYAGSMNDWTAKGLPTE